eukprot:2029035-Prymnesium_polylepis.4
MLHDPTLLLPPHASAGDEALTSEGRTHLLADVPIDTVGNAPHSSMRPLRAMPSPSKRRYECGPRAHATPRMGLD